MEWIIEGARLIFIGVIVVLTVIFGKPKTPLFTGINIASIVMLLTLAVISLFTGYKINFLPFKLCPVIFSVSAVLILLGIIL